MFTLSKSADAYLLYSETSDVALEIDRTSGAYRPASPTKSTGSATNSYQIGAFLGSLQLQTTKYLVVAKTAKLAGKIVGHEIFGLSDYQLLPLRDHTGRPGEDAEREYLSLVAEHLKKATLFWSPTYDLTSSLQRQATQSAKGPLFAQVDHRFFWNAVIAREGIEAAAQTPTLAQYVHVTIYGVASLHDITHHGTPIVFGLISRRSRFRAGTRYFRRGIDDDGNVANFNETEQILVSNDRIYSYLQTRGSVPAKWGEINRMKYRPRLRIGGVTPTAAEKHFAEQKKLYGPNYLINLVNQSGYEKPVKDVYEETISALNDKDLHYIYFDFHHECSGMRWHRVFILIDKLLELGLDKEKWFCRDLTTGQVISKQTSIVRTNCMDCLDRTNVVQSTLGSWTLQKQLEDSGQVSVGTKWEEDREFETAFRNTWADNADGVSAAYSGTGALKTDFTRTGKRTKAGALRDLQNSIVRFYLNNLSDGPRQDGYNLFLGDYQPLDHNNSPFPDKRPLIVQSIPYILGGSAFVFLLSALYPSPNHSGLFDFIVSLVFLLLTVGSYHTVMRNGMQYVNWPKLLPLDFVQWVPGKDGWKIVDKSASSSAKLE